MSRLIAVSVYLLLVIPCRAEAPRVDVKGEAAAVTKPVLKDFINDRTLFMSEGVWHSSPALADLDSDGRLEIIVGTLAGYVYAWHCDGRLVEGWPRKAQQGITSSPAVGDLDGDGYPEVVCVGNVWRHDGTPAGGWPQPANPFCTPALADIDLDGALEVICGNTNNGIDVRHHDGRLATGWPQRTNAEMRVTPAVGDIDGDGFPEIVAHSWDLHLYAWKHDGTLLAGWPVATNGRVESPPSLADVDGDGTPDRILCDQGVYRPNGERTGNGCYGAVPIDLNRDGHTNIVGLAYASSLEGTRLPGWPVRVFGSWSDSVGVADIDGDGNLEVLWSSRNNFLYAYHRDATRARGWPRWLVEVGDTTPAIADLDGDGRLEVVVSTGLGRVYLWQEPALGTANAVAWPMLGGGPKRAGVLEKNVASPAPMVAPLSPIQSSLARGDFESALAAYRGIMTGRLTSQDERAEAILSIARIYYWRLQDDEKAFQEYETLIKDYPHSPWLADAFQEMSDLYRYRLFGKDLQSRFAGVTDAFRKAVEARPDQSSAAREWFLLADACEVLDNGDLSALLEKVMSDYPNSDWARIASLYRKYDGIPHHITLGYMENGSFKTGQQSVAAGDLITAQFTKSLLLTSSAPAKQPFPCQISITTSQKLDKVLGPQYPFPRDPDLVIGGDDLSDAIGKVARQELPDGNTVFRWAGVIRSDQLQTGILGGGGFTATSLSIPFASDIAVERKWEKLAPDRQKCTVTVTSAWEPAVQIQAGGQCGTVDTTTPAPKPSWAIGDMIYFGQGYRTKPEGVPETIAFSFVVTLRPDVDHACPGVRVSSPRPRNAVTHSDLGKPLLHFECPFSEETYQIVSPRRFEVTAVNSSIGLDYQLDPIIIRTDQAQ
jgi:tetratricopeptide (TPR) repeat protein